MFSINHNDNCFLLILQSCRFKFKVNSIVQRGKYCKTFAYLGNRLRISLVYQFIQARLHKWKNTEDIYKLFECCYSISSGCSAYHFHVSYKYMS